MSSRFLPQNMHNHHLEMHSSEKLQGRFTSLLVHNLRDHYFSLFNIPQVLEIKLSVCTKSQVGGLQAPIFNKHPKKSQLKSVGIVFLSQDLKRWNLQLYERK